jgi:probable HAF family extracellular repeat protein
MVGSYNRRIGSEVRTGGFLYAAGMFTLLDVPGATYTQAFGINNHGQIVGVYGDASTPQQGFLYDGGVFTPLSVTVAWGINDAGQIVGTTSGPDGKLVGALDDGGVLTILDVPGSTQTVAHGINNASKIVGSYNDSRGVGHGFLYTAGAFTTIDVPGAAATEAYGINDADQIVGVYYDANRKQHGFLATPDTIPPVITVSANPETLRPPNGQLVTVTVSGTITDQGSGVGSAAYRVIDEYGQIQPSGSIPLGADGRYAFTVQLQASRRGNDQDGRRYTIEISATDVAGNRGSASTTVTVPRN